MAAAGGEGAGEDRDQELEMLAGAAQEPIETILQRVYGIQSMDGLTQPDSDLGAVA